ncbi:MAG: hypothetical protein IT384_26330 [Deltaproteobacteria bacterium]|nr:hypothetical protein [Deltaproteobacteria bacterium]
MSNPGPVDVLSREVVRLLQAQHLEPAKHLLELVFATGVAPPMLLVAYGAVLSELGECERATQIAEVISAIDDPLLEQSGLREQAAAWLPGGALSKERRDALRGDAEKWLPRKSKPESLKGG